MGKYHGEILNIWTAKRFSRRNVLRFVMISILTFWVVGTKSIATAAVLAEQFIGPSVLELGVSKAQTAPSTPGTPGTAGVVAVPRTGSAGPSIEAHRRGKM